MRGICDLPYLKCFVRSEFLYAGDCEGDLESAYAFSVTAFVNRPLLFTVHLDSGALFSGLPIWALVSADVKANAIALPEEDLQPWGCLGERVSVIQHKYLRDYEGLCKIKTREILGAYVATFVFLPDGGFEEDPSQSKTMNLMALRSGQFALLPNNMILFRDKHFTGRVEKWPKYRRNETHFTTES